MTNSDSFISIVDTIIGSITSIESSKYDLEQLNHISQMTENCLQLIKSFSQEDFIKYTDQLQNLQNNLNIFLPILEQHKLKMKQEIDTMFTSSKAQQAYTKNEITAK